MNQQKVIKLREPITCPYCRDPAHRLKGELAKPRSPSDTRYGCTNAHYFAVPTLSVLERG